MNPSSLVKSEMGEPTLSVPLRSNLLALIVPVVILPPSIVVAPPGPISPGLTNVVTPSKSMWSALITTPDAPVGPSLIALTILSLRLTYYLLQLYLKA